MIRRAFLAVIGSLPFVSKRKRWIARRVEHSVVDIEKRFDLDRLTASMKEHYVSKERWPPK